MEAIVPVAISAVGGGREPLWYTCKPRVAWGVLVTCEYCRGGDVLLNDVLDNTKRKDN